MARSTAASGSPIGNDRQTHRPDPDDPGPAVLGRAGPGGHDQGLVAGASEVLDHLTDGVGDPVDLRQERLGDDRDAHGFTVTRPVEHPVSPACGLHEEDIIGA